MGRVLTLVAAGLVLATGARAAAPPGAIEVVSPRPVGIIATGINERGDVIGFEWVEEKERPGVVEQKPFLARGKEVAYLPLLKGYTATFPAAVSDDGLVVGRASKPAPPRVRVYLRNQAFVWDAKAGIRGLGVLEGDWASFACGVSRDGRRVSGYSVGDNRVRPCVWDAMQAATAGPPPSCRTRDGSIRSPCRSAATAGASRPATGPCLASGRATTPVAGPAR
jgi:hypothetical protein